jgi:DNA repair exonuclease SbcCD nuclease subunit
MAKRIVAIASSDWHIHKFKAFDKDDSRLKASLRAGKYIMDAAATLGVPLLHCGDWFHTPKEVENETMSSTIDLVANAKCEIISISGNHDMSEKNSFDHRSPSHLKSFKHIKHFHRIDRNYTHTKTGLFVYGIPYMNNDLDIVKCLEVAAEPRRRNAEFSILLLHSDAPGAMTPEGIKINETEHIPTDYSLFKGWDLVLFGHIHKAQKLHDKAWMLGCPIHQNAGDVGNACGYWEIYEGGGMTFKRLDMFPQFIRLKKGEKPQDDYNYYLEPDEVVEEEQVEQGKFSINTPKNRLAKRYLKAKSIKNKAKLRALIQILNEAE